jgi:hypothetical protein
VIDTVEEVITERVEGLVEWGHSCWIFQVTFQFFFKYLLQLGSVPTCPIIDWSFGQIISMGHWISELTSASDVFIFLFNDPNGVSW